MPGATMPVWRISRHYGARLQLVRFPFSTAIHFHRNHERRLDRGIRPVEFALSFFACSEAATEFFAVVEIADEAILAHFHQHADCVAGLDDVTALFVASDLAAAVEGAFAQVHEVRTRLTCVCTYVCACGALKREKEYN